MPYTVSSDNLPANVKKLSESKRRQWVSVWNSSFKKHNDESRAFAAANAAVKKEATVVVEATKGYISGWDAEMRQVPQDVAEYDPFGAKSGKGCASCQWFVSPDSCVLVHGDIAPGGLSKYFTPRVKYETPPLDVKVVAWDVPVNVKSAPEKEPLITRLGKAVKSFLGLTPEPKPFMVFRDTDNNLRFLVTYSNVFQDRAKEILSTDSHEKYVAWVTKSGLYPELQLWHCGSDSAIGQADWVDFCDGFCHASGLIKKEYEALAEKLAESDLGVSHGFIGLKQLENSNVYSEYMTFEISLLPREAAANIYLNTLVSPNSKEYVMPFSEQKKAWLKAQGLGDDVITAWENNSKALGDTLKGMNVEYKSSDEGEVPATTETPVSTSTESTPATPAPTPDAGLGIITKGLMDTTTAIQGVAGLVQQLVANQKALEAKVEAIGKPINEQVEQHFAAATSPAAALATAHVASQSPTTVTKEASQQAAVEQDLGWFDQEALAQFKPVTGGS